jgi:hypothetical protein
VKAGSHVFLFLVPEVFLGEIILRMRTGSVGRRCPKLFISDFNPFPAFHKHALLH